MRQFLYLCLFGTALAGGVAQATVPDVSALTAKNILDGGMSYGAAMDAANATVSSAASGASTMAATSVDVSALTAKNILDGGMSYGAAMDAANAAVQGAGYTGASAVAETGGLWSSVSDGLANGWSWTKDAATGVGNWVSDGVSSVGSSLKSVWNTSVDKMTGLFSGSTASGAASSLTSGTPILGNQMASQFISGANGQIVTLSNATNGLLKGTDGNFYSNIGGKAFQLSSKPLMGDEVMGQFISGANGQTVTLSKVGDGFLTGSDGGLYTQIGGDAVRLDTLSNADMSKLVSGLPDDATKVGVGGAEFVKNPDGTWTNASAKQAENAAKAGEKAGEAEAQAAMAVAPDKASVYNVIQYAIVILQALEGTEQEDITKEVTVKAQELQDSQGSSTPSTISETPSTPDASLVATSLTGAANAMIALLQNNPIYPSLLSEESCLLSGTSAASGTASRDSTEDVRATNNYIQCMQKKRLAFANTTALSAQVIAEGSNAISHEFYDRVSSLATAAKGTTGTLGSMSVVNDSERFPYFEMVRGSALSAIQLELKGAETLSELTGVMEEVKDAQ